MKLYLTEKPKTARQLCDVLGPNRHIKSSDSTKFGGHKQGDGWAVAWLSGHMYRLLEPHEINSNLKQWRLRDLPIIHSDIEWKPIDSSETIPVEQIHEQIEHIKSLYPKVTEMILATDGDQEGQVLGQVFLEQTGWNGPVKRFWTDLWEPSGLKANLAKIRDNADYQGTYYAGTSRIILDQLLGINLTRLFTLKAQQSGYNMVANSGRVISPALSIVVDHDNKVRAHSSNEYYSLRCNLEFQGQPFRGKFLVPDSLLTDKTHCFDKAAIVSIQQLLQSESTAQVVTVEPSEKSHKPPKPFSQNTLAQFCNLHYGLLPTETLAACQSLYEAGYTSYPRVEVEVYETDVLYKAPDILEMLRTLNDQFKSAVESANIKNAQPVFSDAEVAGHSAIFVSSLKPNLGQLSVNELNVYCAIANRFIAQFSSDMVTAHNAIKVRINNYFFTADSLSVIQPGWAALEPKTITEKPELPLMRTGDECAIKDIQLHQRRTKAPPRLTVDVFLSILRDCTHLLSPKVSARIGKGQLGTGATQPGILNNLTNNGFAQIIDKKYIVPTKRGRDLRGLLPDLIASVDLTSLWELNFRDIRNGNLSHTDFITAGLGWIEKLIHAGKTSQFPKSPTLTPCPICESAMIRKKSNSNQHEHYWLCTFEDCKTSLPDVAGLPMQLHADHGKPCGKCGEPMISKLKKSDRSVFINCKKCKTGIEE
jgi:DNA topoisomerase-3